MADEPKTPARTLLEVLGLPTEPEPSSFGTLADLVLGVGRSRPPRIVDRWFKDERIKIDGYTFERCRFDRCTLITEMATFTFRNCYVAPECKLVFAGPALKVTRLLMHVLRIKGLLTAGAGPEAIFAAQHSDETFSIE